MKKLLVVIIIFQFQFLIGQNLVKFDSIVFKYNLSTSASRKNISETEVLEILINEAYENEMCDKKRKALY